jgi:hypothetical protein
MQKQIGKKQKPVKEKGKKKRLAGWAEAWGLLRTITATDVECLETPPPPLFVCISIDPECELTPISVRVLGLSDSGARRMRMRRMSGT